MAIRIFQHYWQLPLVLLAVAEAAAFFVAPYVAHAFRFGVWRGAGLAPWALLFACVMFLSMAAVGLYNARQRSRLRGVLTRVAVSVTGAMALLCLLNVVVDGEGYKHIVIAASIAFAAVALLRTGFERLVDEDVFKRRVLVYGAGKRALSIARLRRRSDRRGFAIVGYVPAEGDDFSGVATTEKMLRPDDLLSLCRTHRVSEVVVAMDDRRRRFPMDQLLECRLDGVEIVELVSFLERETGKVRLDVLNPSWMIFSEGFRNGRFHSLLERLFDVVASLVLLVATIPIMLFIAIAIKLSDGWRAPVFYRQVRVGQYGRRFQLLKFRSMREDAESDGQPRWAQKNDNRVTPLGSFMRITRLDELPQILNVLRGEMSFVGPRPERPEFVEQLNERIPYYRERHSIKPGITGWAQLCYPYGSSEHDAAEKLQYDLFYVKNHSLLFYFAILVQTVEVIIWTKGRNE